MTKELLTERSLNISKRIKNLKKKEKLSEYYSKSAFEKQKKT